ncbi:MAG: hypothetical protein JWP69_2363 [Flaviaesturariibacter sp.]|nr:hypothetical protein [Flaviaesturariibacter sp.]
MHSRLSWFFLCVLFLLVGCNQRFQSEKEEVDYWASHVLTPVYKILHTTHKKEIALLVYDSLLKKQGFTTPYIKAARHDIAANYYYFYTQDNATLARTIDSALSYFNTAALQSRYPRTYVGLLLFGGDIAYRLLRYNRANDYYFLAKKIADAHLTPCERSAFTYNMAMVLYRQKSFDRSAEHFKDAYASQATCAVQTTAIALQQQEIQSNIGLCLWHLKKHDSTLLHFDKAQAIANQYRDSLGAATMEKINGVLYGNKAKVYIDKNQLVQAEELSLKSVALNARPGYELKDALKVQL